MKTKICFRVRGLAVDENGLPAPAGLCMEMETDKPIETPYEELAASIDKLALLRILCLEGIVSPDDVEIISPEEYDNEYD